MYLHLSDNNNYTNTEILIKSLKYDRDRNNENNENEINEILNSIKNCLQHDIDLYTNSIEDWNQCIETCKMDLKKMNERIKDYEKSLNFQKNKKNLCENLIKKYKL